MILVDSHDQEIGQMEKLEVHKKALLHRAFSVLVFNSNNELLLHKRADGKYHSGGLWTNTCCGHPRPGEDILSAGKRRLYEEMGFDCALFEMFSFVYQAELDKGLSEHEFDHVLFGKFDGIPQPDAEEASAWKYSSIEGIKQDVEKNPQDYTIWFKIILEQIDPYLIKVPYLGMKNVSKQFRHKKPQEYDLTDVASNLYQSKICAAIKSKLRQREGSAVAPAKLDFGPVQYVIASHFGFCLGVANAIDIAYEAIRSNPGKRVFMLSELIHNSFVNEDLRSRGLQYLQTEKGLPFKADSGRLLWDELKNDDIVIIPAFGASNEDKARLIEKGINITEYDATCRLVENVWTRARMYGEKGFTIILHGKSEHEETKASFSNSRAYAPTLIVRDMKEAHVLGKVILEEDTDLFYSTFEEKYSERFNPEIDLAKLAVVNQTTLLASETLAIADYLRTVLIQKYGASELSNHFGESGKDKLGNTLCYATNVNQEATRLMLEEAADFAFIIGGHNSSNTSQLYRLAEDKFAEKAFYIQSEKDILSLESIAHYEYRTKQVICKPFASYGQNPLRVMITAGASCPDGIIQQVVMKINSFFAMDELRDIDDVLADFAAEAK